MWPTVCKFPIPLIEPLQLLQYSKFQMALVTNYGQMHGVQMNVLYNGRLGSFLFLVSCKTHYNVILLTCVPFPALRTTLIVAILQAPDGKDSGKISFV